MLYPKDLGMMGVFFTAGGDPVQLKGGRMVLLKNVVPMYGTGLNTDDGTPIWEADVLDCDVPNEWGSFIRARGAMAWDDIIGKWVLQLPSEHAREDFVVANATIAGNLYEHPDLLHQPVSHGT